MSTENNNKMDTFTFFDPDTEALDLICGESSFGDDIPQSKQMSEVLTTSGPRFART